MAGSGKDRRMLLNDDGWIVGDAEPPMTAEVLREKMVAVYDGTPVDAILWSVGGHEVFDFETEVGERFGEGYEGFDDPRHEKKRENLQNLIEESGGPLTALARLYHEAGIDLFASVRMNEHYDIDPASPRYGRLRREHPELLIGRQGEELAQSSLEWGIRTGLNYTFPEVRGFMTRIVFELFEKFDVDGVELDFMRHPAFFRIEEAYANRYLMTDMVKRIRERMKEVAAEKGRPLELGVRVPPTLADCKRIGIDVAEWMAEGLVDIVVAGGGFMPFDMPIQEFVEVARGAYCRVYGCLEYLRPTQDDEVVRGVASRYWSAGVDGLYFMNYHSRDAGWKRRMLNQVAYPAALGRLDKRYELDHSTRLATKAQLGLSFRNAIPAAQLPVRLEETLTGRGAVLRLGIPDDPGTAEKTVLTLRLENASPEDKFELSVNRVPVAWEPGRVTQTDEHLQLDVDSPPLKRGDNELEVRLVERIGNRAGAVHLKDVEATIRYGQE